MKTFSRFVAVGLAVVLSGVAPVIAATQDPPPPPPQKAPLRVGGAVKTPERLTYVVPDYPNIAKQAKIQGTVILEVLIAKDGSVSATKVLKPMPLLDQAAVDAVKQWKYAPSFLDGEPIEVIMVVTVGFSLK